MARLELHDAGRLEITLNAEALVTTYQLWREGGTNNAALARDPISWQVYRWVDDDWMLTAEETGQYPPPNSIGPRFWGLTIPLRYPMTKCKGVP